jgi:hypothetical protein
LKALIEDASGLDKSWKVVKKSRSPSFCLEERSERVNNVPNVEATLDCWTEDCQYSTLKLGATLGEETVLTQADP